MPAELLGAPWPGARQLAGAIDYAWHQPVHQGKLADSVDQQRRCRHGSFKADKPGLSMNIKKADVVHQSSEPSLLVLALGLHGMPVRITEYDLAPGPDCNHRNTSDLEDLRSVFTCTPRGKAGHWQGKTGEQAANVGIHSRRRREVDIGQKIHRTWRDTEEQRWCHSSNQDTLRSREAQGEPGRQHDDEGNRQEQRNGQKQGVVPVPPQGLQVHRQTAPHSLDELRGRLQGA